MASGHPLGDHAAVLIRATSCLLLLTACSVPVVPSASSAGADRHADAWGAEDLSAAAIEAAEVVERIQVDLARADQDASARGRSGRYARLRVGVYDPRGDLASLDSGTWVDLTVGQRLNQHFAVEAQGGWFGTEGPLGFELDAFPLFLNGRVNVPVSIFEPYAGIGAGAVIADYTGGSDTVAAWQGFAGVEAGAGGVSLGVEYRYLQSERTEAGFGFEGQTVMLIGSVGF